MRVSETNRRTDRQRARERESEREIFTQPATVCNSLQHAAACCCKTQQHTATH